MLITAGPTYENLDPVRFIGNYSSGKMGFEIAKAAANLGAKVTLVSGPSHESVTGFPIDRINVVSARDMYEAMHANFADADAETYKQYLKESEISPKLTIAKGV